MMTKQDMYFFVEKPVTTVEKTRLVDKDNRFIKEPEEGCKEETYKASYLMGLLLDTVDLGDFNLFQIEINKEGRGGSLTPAEIFESLMDDLGDLKLGNKIIKATVKLAPWGFSNDPAPSKLNPTILKVEALEANEEQKNYIEAYKAQLTAFNQEDEPADLAI